MALGRRRDDTGSYSVEAILTITLVFTIIFGTFQVALWATARSAARDAANGAVVAASLERGTAETGKAEAERRLARTGTGLLDNRTVEVTRTATEVRVTVKGDVLSLIPGFPVHVNVTSTGSVERWSTP